MVKSDKLIYQSCSLLILSFYVRRSEHADIKYMYMLS